MVRPLEGENTPVIIERWYHTEKPKASGAWASRRVPFSTSQDYSIFEREASELLQSLLALRKPMRGSSIGLLSQQPLDARLSGGPCPRLGDNKGAAP
jgi:hypothetical protein